MIVAKNLAKSEMASTKSLTVLNDLVLATKSERDGAHSEWSHFQF